MGITIHYRGKLHPKVKPKEFYLYAGLTAKEKGWKASDLFESEGPALLAHPEEDLAYNGKLSTFVIEPHEHCEPLAFQITADGYFRNWCKTQFAPLEIHKGIVDFFSQMRIKFSEMVIQDEGGFWELRDEKVLEERIVTCFLEMQKTKDEDPEYYGPVKNEKGRITDLVK